MYLHIFVQVFYCLMVVKLNIYTLHVIVLKTFSFISTDAEIVFKIKTFSKAASAPRYETYPNFDVASIGNDRYTWYVRKKSS